VEVVIVVAARRIRFWVRVSVKTLAEDGSGVRTQNRTQNLASALRRRERLSAGVFSVALLAVLVCPPVSLERLFDARGGWALMTSAL